MTKTSPSSTHDPLKYIALCPPPLSHNQFLFVYKVIITSTLKQWLIAFDYETNSFNSNLLSLESKFLMKGKNDKMYPYDFLLFNLRIYVHNSIVK